MNLRTRALVLSLLPLALTLLLVIPETTLQLSVISATQLDHSSDLAVTAAYDIEDYRLAAAGDLRRQIRRHTIADGPYSLATSTMRSAIRRLEAVVGSDRVEIEGARRITSDAETLLEMFDGVRAELRRGHFSAAGTIMASSVYLDRIDKLQADEREFTGATDELGARQFASVGRLWSTSILLLLLGVVGLALVSAILIYHSGAAVRGIMEVGRKSERYRRGESIGAPSSRRDEIGLLDAAVHQFVAAEEVRQRQLRRYRLLADTTRDLIVFFDRLDLTVVDANAAALAAYGYERADFIGQSSTIFLTPGQPSDPTLAAQADTPAGLHYEVMHRRSDGTQFPVEVRANTADVDGRLTVIATMRDISERRRAQEQVTLALDQAVEASRLKGEFVATMSHEIRTPMHGVIGMSELLLETQLNPVQREYAVTVKESAQALLAIIDDILDFSKLEAHKVELEAVAFDPAQLVAGAINLARGTARERGLTLRSHASPHVPAAVRGDPTRLRQVLINLIGNAVKFTRAGEVSVSISVDRDDGRAVVLAFSVSDTGIGVAAGDRERLFEAFVQGDGSTTRRFGGSGLGLTISRRLVELMGGTIWLGEHDGPGSTFCFTARFERAAETVAPIADDAVGPRIERAPIALLTTPSNGHRRVRILMAEDSALIRRVASFQLEELKYGVDVVDDGAQAVAAIAGGDYELVLMDLRMPEMDGLTAARAIRDAERVTGRHIVIVALTANVLDSDREACLAAGMDDFLAKPLKLDALRAVLERWLPEPA